MNFKEVKFEDVNSLAPDWEFVDRYTNRNGLKFYMVKKKQLGSEDFENRIKIMFGAYPKYYDSGDLDPPEFIFEFGVGKMYKQKLISDTYLIEFLEKYGISEFTKWLNEINELKSQGNKVILTTNDEKIKPELSNGKLIFPTNIEDDNRFYKIAEETILTEF